MTGYFSENWNGSWHWPQITSENFLCHHPNAVPNLSLPHSLKTFEKKWNNKNGGGRWWFLQHRSLLTGAAQAAVSRACCWGFVLPFRSCRLWALPGMWVSKRKHLSFYAPLSNGSCRADGGELTPEAKLGLLCCFTPKTKAGAVVPSASPCSLREGGAKPKYFSQGELLLCTLPKPRSPAFASFPLLLQFSPSAPPKKCI